MVHLYYNVTSLQVAKGYLPKQANRCHQVIRTTEDSTGKQVETPKNTQQVMDAKTTKDSAGMVETPENTQQAMDAKTTKDSDQGQQQAEVELLSAPSHTFKYPA